jgi:alpha-L-fucosidase
MTTEYNGDSKASHNEKMQWWREARFGMFIHWGLYAIPQGIWKGKEIDGIGEWIMHRARIPVNKYEKLAGAFNPVEFNAKRWVKLAKRAGMKYLTITSKHHDGFALFKSNASPYNMVDATPFKRDVIAELAKECKKAGLKLCFYYSQKQDWHHPDASGNDWDFNPDEQDFAKYMEEKALPQVKEILTQYGPIGMIWYDTPQDITEAQTRAFVDAVYELQPDCLVNGRAGHDIGDYRSMGDNMIPPVRLEGDWETPATLNDTWGFKKNDKNWKSTKSLVCRLVDIVSKGGNYLLNVGPTAEGVIPNASVKRLKRMGKWLKVNGESVYGASASPSPHEQSWGSITSKPGRVYLNFVSWPDRKFKLYGLQSKVKKAYILSDRKKKDLPFKQENFPDSDVDVLRINLHSSRPDKYVSVVVLKVEGEPEMDPSIIQQADGSVVLEAVSASIQSPEEGSQLVSGRFGTLENWLRTEHVLQWDVKVIKPGIFDVMVFSQTEHGGEWEGAHRVSLDTGESKASGELLENERKSNPRTDVLRKEILSRIGRVMVSRAGRSTIAFQADHLNTEKGLGLKLRAVHLIPV